MAAINVKCLPLTSIRRLHVLIGILCLWQLKPVNIHSVGNTELLCRTGSIHYCVLTALNTKNTKIQLSCLFDIVNQWVTDSVQIFYSNSPASYTQLSRFIMDPFFCLTGKPGQAEKRGNWLLCGSHPNCP